MGIEAAVLGAVIGGGASLVGSAMDRRAQGKAANKANEVSAARTQAGLNALQPGFQTAQDIQQQAYGVGNQMRQQGMTQGLDIISQLYGPTAGMQQQGYMDAQRALLAGLPLQRAAILGGKIDYSQLQPSQTQYDPRLLAGIFANQQLPQGAVNFAPFPAAQAMR